MCQYLDIVGGHSFIDYSCINFECRQQFENKVWNTSITLPEAATRGLFRVFYSKYSPDCDGGDGSLFIKQNMNIILIKYIRHKLITIGLKAYQCKT